MYDLYDNYLDWPELKLYNLAFLLKAYFIKNGLKQTIKYSYFSCFYLFCIAKDMCLNNE